jgi:hypothetical protein
LPSPARRAFSRSATPFRISHEPTLRAFAQACWLQRFPLLEVIREGTPNLGNEWSLIFRIPEGSRGEFGGPQLQKGSGEFRVLPHRVPSSNG